MSRNYVKSTIESGDGSVLRDSRRFDKIGNGKQIAASVSALDGGFDVIP